jgi:hypothetical protein
VGKRFKAMRVRREQGERIRSAGRQRNITNKGTRNLGQQIRSVDWLSPRFDLWKFNRCALHVGLRSARSDFGVERCWPYPQPGGFDLPPAIVLGAWQHGKAHDCIVIWLLRFADT